jgi:hypothetical protein
MQYRACCCTTILCRVIVCSTGPSCRTAPLVGAGFRRSVGAVFWAMQVQTCRVVSCQMIVQTTVQSRCHTAQCVQMRSVPVWCVVLWRFFSLNPVRVAHVRSRQGWLQLQRARGFWHWHESVQHHRYLCLRYIRQTIRRPQQSVQMDISLRLQYQSGARRVLQLRQHLFCWHDCTVCRHGFLGAVFLPCRQTSQGFWYTILQKLF